jgi:hypothetical protein
VLLTVFFLFKNANLYVYWSLCVAGCVASLAICAAYLRTGKNSSFDSATVPCASIDDAIERLPGRWPVHALLILSALLFAMPPIYRVASGCPLNDECLPAVCSPEQNIRIFLSPPLWTLEGKWGGNAEATWVNSDQFKTAPNLIATTQRCQIDSSIDDESQFVFPYVNVDVPNQKVLEGNSMKLLVNLAATYPVSDNSREFHYEETIKTRELTLHVATPPQALQDKLMHLCFLFTVLVMLLVVACTVSRNYRLVKAAPEPKLQIDSIKQKGNVFTSKS